MRCYCTLHINSRHRPELPAGMFLGKALRSIEFTDNESPERVARRDRLSAKGIVHHSDLPRYWWQLDSDGKVSGDDVHAHLAWLVAQLRKDKLLSELKAGDYQYWFSVFWPGNGTGGGPLVTRQAVELLARHEAELGVGFYYEEAT